MTKSWTDERMEERFDAIDGRFDAVDRRFDGVDQRFDTVDQRFDEVGRRLEEVDRRCDRVDADFRELRGEMNSRFDTTQRLIIQIGAGMFATLVIGFLGVITQL